jgi:hypothetical protein
MPKMKTYMFNHIPIKQMWLEENIILIKDVQKWVDKKMLNNPMKKKIFYNIFKGPKFKKWVLQKMKG